MRVKMFLIVALIAGAMVLFCGGIRQAQAYNLILAADQGMTTQIAILLEDNHGGPTKRADAEKTVQDIEPAAGEE